jgi:predicted PurR-regulated permease PerM
MKLPTRSSFRPVSASGQTVIAAIGVAGLYCGRQVLIPIALASLLSFVLTPPLILLQRFRIPRGLAVALVTLFSFTILGVIGLEVGRQATELASDFPKYETGLRDKVQSLRDSARNGALLRNATKIVSGLTSDLSGSVPARVAPPADEAPAAEAHGQGQPAVPVVVRQPEPTPLAIASQVLGPVVEPLSTAGITILFVVFILLERESIRDRLIWLLGARDIRRTTVALDDAALRLSRYFLAQTGINAAFGFLFGAGLWLIGIPNFALWGFLAMLLRFLPYIGGLMAASLPVILAAAIDPGWSTLLWTATLFLVLETITGQLVEPTLFGHTTGMSPLAVVGAATFWTALWGPIGLLLSTPLTLLLVVLGQHFEPFKLFAAVLGEEPPLEPDQSFYHKIITGHADEALDQAYLVLKERSLVAYYDEYALPGLRLLQDDLNRGTLSRDDLAPIVATIDEIIDALEDCEEGEAEATTGKEANETDMREASVLCLPGRSPFDLSAAAMLAQVLRKQGVNARLLEGLTVSSLLTTKTDTSGTALTCLSYVAVDHSPSHVRTLARRLRRRMPGVRLLAGFWTYSEDGADDSANETLKADAGTDFIATSLQDAVTICLDEVRATPDRVSISSQTVDSVLAERPAAVAGSVQVSTP